MAKSSKSIEKTVIVYAGLPMVLVLVLLVALFAFTRIAELVDARESLLNEYSFALQVDSLSAEQLKELESIRLERLAEIDREFWNYMAVAVVILLLGVAIPILASKHIASIMEQNLTLLRERVTHRGREGAALMPQVFDFNEFGELADRMGQILSEHGETELRWKRAEKELVDTNKNLFKQANELEQQNQTAHRLKEAAQLSEQQLKELNERLELAVKEAQLSAQQAESANHAKSDFLATMSHEIRTPMNGVLGFINILSETDLNRQQLEYLDAIRSSGKTLLFLINDILDFTKIESGHLELEIRRFNLVTTLRELVAIFANQATQKSIKLRLDIGDDVPREINGDEIRIRQILTNLLSNAVKFTESGEVCLSVRGDARQHSDGLSLIEFEVRDSGIGIHPEQLESLFCAFTQADSSMTRKYGGTGLGLAICKRLAEAMRGKVWATSQIGEGSCFYAQIRVQAIAAAQKATPRHIPIKNEASQAHSASQPVRTLGEKIPLKIVVAEDDKANQRVLKIVLKRMGWDAVFAENGVELIDYLKVNSCDLIFMDLQMPIMGGVEATQLIRDGVAGDEIKGVKIIALTANSLGNEQSMCMEAGMDGFLTKPLAVDLLKQQIVSLFPAEASDLTKA
jgi:signal transduction histidine kinase/ActR/RegA family two-component response regulator